MNKEIASAIAGFLSRGIRLRKEEVPKSLLSTEFVEQTVVEPQQCPNSNCSSGVHTTKTSKNDIKGFETKCYKSNHFEFVPSSKRNRFVINTTNVLTSLAEAVRLTPKGSPNTKNLPRFSSIETSEGVRVYLIHRPTNYSDTVQDIFTEAVENGEVSLLLTPQEEVREILEIAEVFAVGSLVCPLPLHLVSNDRMVDELLTAAQRARTLSEDIRENREIKEDSYNERENINPSYTLSELNYLRVLRENGELRSGEGGVRLEHACSSAFSHLFAIQPGVGGEDDSGVSIPDTLFYLDESPNKKYSCLLGILDSKSGKTGNFSQEKVSNKQRNYIERVRNQPIFRGFSFAHVFVVFDVDGHKEIDFYDEMKSSYKDDTAMVVLLADALMYMLAAHLAAFVSNELKISEGDFCEVLRPFFDRDAYSEELSEEIRQMTRFDSRDSYPSGEFEKYYERYREREGLIVVTSEMVHNHFKHTIEEKKRLEHILQGYLLA